MEENKEGVKKIYEESKEKIKIEEIEISKSQKETQEKLNKICVIYNKEEGKEIRKKEREEVKKIDKKIKGGIKKIDKKIVGKNK